MKKNIIGIFFSYIRYAELDSFHVEVVTKLSMTEAENRQHRKRNNEILQQLNQAMNARETMQDELHSLTAKYEKALRDIQELNDQLTKVKKQRDEANKECHNAMNGRNKANRERQQMYEERNIAIREYNLIMSERDSVHKEIEKLQEDLQDIQKRNETIDKEYKITMEEMETLRRELASALLDRDRALKTFSDLREKYGESSMTSHHSQTSFNLYSLLPFAQQDSQQSLQQQQDFTVDGIHTSPIIINNNNNLSSSSNSSLIGNIVQMNLRQQSPTMATIKNLSLMTNVNKTTAANPPQQQQIINNQQPMMTMTTSSSTSSVSTFGTSQQQQQQNHHQPLIHSTPKTTSIIDNNNSSNNSLASPVVNLVNTTTVGGISETESLREQVKTLQLELQRALQEIDSWKTRRDCAINERDKIVLERESVRALCDKLRRERDRKISDLADALRELYESRRQKNETTKEVELLKEKFDSAMKANKTAINQLNLNEKQQQKQPQQSQQQTNKPSITCTSQDSAIDVDDAQAAIAQAAMNQQQQQQQPPHHHRYLNNNRPRTIVQQQQSNNKCSMQTVSLPILMNNNNNDYLNQSIDTDSTIAIRRMFGFAGDLVLIVNHLTHHNKQQSISEHKNNNNVLNHNDRIVSINGTSLNKILSGHLFQFMCKSAKSLDSDSNTIKVQLYRCQSIMSSPGSLLQNQQQQQQQLHPTTELDKQHNYIAKVNEYTKPTNLLQQAEPEKQSSLAIIDSVDDESEIDDEPRATVDEDNDADEDEPNSDVENESEVKTIARLDQMLEQYQIEDSTSSYYGMIGVGGNNDGLTTTVTGAPSSFMNDNHNNVQCISSQQKQQHSPTTTLQHPSSNTITGIIRRSSRSNKKSIKQRNSTLTACAQLTGAAKELTAAIKNQLTDSNNSGTGDTWPRYRPHQFLSSMLPSFYKNHGLNESQKNSSSATSKQQPQTNKTEMMIGNMKHLRTPLANMDNINSYATTINRRKHQRKSLGIFLDIFPTADLMMKSKSHSQSEQQQQQSNKNMDQSTIVSSSATPPATTTTSIQQQSVVINAASQLSAVTLRQSPRHREHSQSMINYENPYGTTTTNSGNQRSTILPTTMNPLKTRSSQINYDHIAALINYGQQQTQQQHYHRSLPSQQHVLFQQQQQQQQPQSQQQYIYLEQQPTTVSSASATATSKLTSSSTLQRSLTYNRYRLFVYFNRKKNFTNFVFNILFQLKNYE